MECSKPETRGEGWTRYLGRWRADECLITFGETKMSPNPYVQAGHAEHKGHKLPFVFSSVPRVPCVPSTTRDTERSKGDGTHSYIYGEYRN